MISFRQKDEGFTGLEAAIVLIAFVVVAAVFSYVVLGAGFFTTQKSQEVVHTGVQQASSTLEIVGNVYGTAQSSGAPIDAVNFTMALAPGGTPVDVSKMTMTYSNKTQVETLAYAGGTGASRSAPSPGGWTILNIRNDIDSTYNNLLEKGEQFEMMAMPTNTIPADTEFSLEVKPITGASLGIKRTTPPSTKVVNILY
jgi:flagellin FlaB